MIIIAKTNEQRKDAYYIRTEVFVEEQQVPMELELDEHEEDAIHFVLYDNNEPIGASRLRFVDRFGKLERICILKSHRGKSYGRKIINRMEEEIIAKDYEQATLNAQTYAIKFYKKLGYKVVSKPFMDAGIPHVTMEKNL